MKTIRRPLPCAGYIAPQCMEGGNPHPVKVPSPYVSLFGQLLLGRSELVYVGGGGCLFLQLVCTKTPPQAKRKKEETSVVLEDLLLLVSL